MSESTDESRASDFKNWVKKYSEEEQATLLILVGAVLFLIPEPITSIVGAFMVVLGGLTWFSDWIWG